MNKRILLIVGAMVLLAGIVGGSYALGQHSQKKVSPSVEDKTPSLSTSPTSNIHVGTADQINDTIKEVKDGKFYRMGQTVQYATLSLVVNSAKTDTLVTSFNQAYPASAGTKWLIINATMTNTSKQPFSFQPFVLASDDGTVINPDTSASSYGEGMLANRTLNPGVPVTGNMLFSVPVGLKATNIGSINASTDVFEGVKLTF